jgi:HEAT repeat protein
LSLDNYLAELGNESKPIVFKKLANLTSLSANELVQFLERFAHMGIKRRAEIIEGLTDLAEENVEMNFNDIFIACLQDPDATVRAGSVGGLWEYEDRSLIDTLIAMLNQDRQESVRAAAAMGLGKFALLAELGELHREDKDKIEGALVSVIESGGEALEVRRRAVESIAVFSSPEVAQIILAAYSSAEHKMRVSAIYAMGMSCDPQWLETLLKELGNPDAEIRYEAAVACGELGEEEAVPYLIELIHDVDPQVQLFAITALGRIGGDGAEAALSECLNDLDGHVRDAAEDAMDELSLNRDPFTFRI